MGGTLAVAARRVSREHERATLRRTHCLRRHNCAGVFGRPTRVVRTNRLLTISLNKEFSAPAFAVPQEQLACPVGSAVEMLLECRSSPDLPDSHHPSCHHLHQVHSRRTRQWLVGRFRSPPARQLQELRTRSRDTATYGNPQSSARGFSPAECADLQGGDHQDDRQNLVNAPPLSPCGRARFLQNRPRNRIVRPQREDEAAPAARPRRDGPTPAARSQSCGEGRRCSGVQRIASLNACTAPDRSLLFANVTPRSVQHRDSTTFAFAASRLFGRACKNPSRCLTASSIAPIRHSCTPSPKRASGRSRAALRRRGMSASSSPAACFSTARFKYARPCGQRSTTVCHIACADE